jgi:hypothetical protein
MHFITSRSVMMPTKTSPSITSSDPVCWAHIRDAAALIGSDGDSVMLAVVMTSLTYMAAPFAAQTPGPLSLDDTRRAGAAARGFDPKGTHSQRKAPA